MILEEQQKQKNNKILKQILIKCDKCNKECPPNTFSSFFYMTIAQVDKQFKQVVREEQYCSEHTEKIREAISKLK